MDVIDLLEIVSKPVGFKRGLTYVGFGHVALGPGSPNVFSGNNVELAPDEVAYVIAASVNVWSETVISAANLRVDTARFGPDFQHNGISLITSPANITDFDITHWLNTSMVIAPFTTSGGSESFHLSGSGYFPILKTVGPGGDLVAGVKKFGALTGEYNIRGHLLVVIAKHKN